MSAKQDRQGARTVADLERRYDWETRFADIMGVASDARTAAETAQNAAAQAQQAADSAAAKLTPEEVFNLLTENGTLQGVYRGDDGEIYINASYLKSGIIDASLIKTGILQSADGAIRLDLNSGALAGYSSSGKLLFDLRKNSANTGAVMQLMSNDQTKAIELDVADDSARIGFSLNGRTRIMMLYLPAIDESQLQIENILADKIKGKTISWKANGDGTYTLIGT